MPWARFDERFPGHRKVRRLSDAAFRLHVSAICWACEYMSDGAIATDDLMDVSEVKRPAAAVAELVRSGRWHEPGHECDSEHCRPIAAGWLIHNFLEYQPSRADIEATRSWDRKRQSLYRDKPLVDAIKKRDKDRCRYCGQLVSWTDRRSPLGGQLDHVIPRGPNTLENIVVACRGCNTRKGGRTPAEAGMPLLDSGSLGSDLGSSSSDDLNTRPSDDSVPSRTVPNRPPLQTPTVSAAATITQRSKRITDAYAAAVPLSNWPAVNGVVLKAMRSERYADDEIAAAMGRLARDGRSVTVETLRTELEGFAPRQQANKATERTQQGLAIVRKLEAEQRGEIA